MNKVISSLAGVFLTGIIVLNVLTSIIPAIWLIVLGHLDLVIGGVVLLVPMVFLIGLLLLPSLLILSACDQNMEDRSRFKYIFLSFIGLLLMNVTLIAFNYVIYLLFTRNLSSINRIPLLLWAYNIALVPLNFNTIKSYMPDDDVIGFAPPFFSNIAFILVVIIKAIIDISNIGVLICFILCMSICFILQLVNLHGDKHS